MKFGVAAVVATALVAAGCGGGGGAKTASGGAAGVAPGNAAAYVSLSTDLGSPAWKKAQALLDRFPGKDTILANLRSSLEQEGLDWETDVKPALGKELDLVWLDLEGADVVGVTKPKDADKFNALLDRANVSAHEQVDGWTVFAHDQSLLDRFDQARSDHGSLDGDSTFADAMDGLPGDSIAKAFVRGAPIVDALKQRLSTAAPVLQTFGSLDSIGAALTPDSDGVRLAWRFTGGFGLGGSYHAALPSSLPSGALLYVSFKGLGSKLDALVEKLGSSSPTFDQQKAQIELVLGYPLSDVFALLDGESAFALYPSVGGTPSVLFVAQVSDESKARSIVDRLATLAAATGRLQMRTVRIGSAEAHEITLQNGTKAYIAVFDGKLVSTTSRVLIEGMQNGLNLLSDSAYTTAIKGMPDETSGFVYADLGGGLPALFDYLENHGRSVRQVVKDNTAPLRGLLLYGSTTGDTFTFTGFLGIQ